MFFDFIIYAISGSVAGLLAGLLGVGGGLVVVPMLVFAFGYQGISNDIIMHLALGTSMASIIFTSISSARSHHKKGAVDWAIVKRIALGIVIGTFTGSFIATKIQAQYLQIFFVFFLLYVSWQMIFSKTPKPSRTMPQTSILSFVGVGIGIISSLVGIGGGTLSVPFMVWHNVEMRKAIATSSAIGIPIAVSGCFGYIVNGIGFNALPTYSLGFIYLPALSGIVVCSVLTAPIGARLAHSLPIPIIKKCFAILMLLVAFEMFLDAI